MKKNLLPHLFYFIAFFLTEKPYAQCLVSDLAIELKSSVPVAGGCRVIFNFSWNQEVNDGNKFAYLHLWNSNQYPDLMSNGTAYTNSSDFPDYSDLVHSLGTIVIDGNGTATPVIGTEYHPQLSIPVISSAVRVHKEYINALLERMTVENIELIIPDCSCSGITGDIWASQAANGKNVHCVSSDVSLVVGNPRISGLMNCAVPRLYIFQVNNLAQTPISIKYNVFIDEGDGVYEPLANDLKITPDPVGPITIPGNESYSSGWQSYLPYSQQKPYSDNGLWIELTTEGVPNKTIYFIENTCIPLPVIFKLFTIQRDGSVVKLHWKTETEQNNTGFEVQQKDATGDFKTIAFIPTIATAGTSATELSYAFAHNNTSTLISEYRIRQIDFDRRSTYTHVNAVKGYGQPTGIVIYPNPSENGEIRVIFDDMNMHAISIIDMAGRITRKWNVHSENNLSVTGLTPGIYLIKVVDHANGKVHAKKFLVQSK